MIESSYTKLFSSIVTSTIWREDDKTRIVWITLLAIKNRHGQVAGSIPGLAALANVSIADCETALAKLRGPDTYSRSREFDGRRIENVEGGWQILNHGKYRDAMSQDERRAYQAEWQKKYRKRQKEVDAAVDAAVDSVESTLTHADTEADTEADTNAGTPPDRALSEWVVSISRMYPSQWTTLKNILQGRVRSAQTAPARAEWKRRLNAVEEKLLGPPVPDVPPPKPAEAPSKPCPEEDWQAGMKAMKSEVASASLQVPKSKTYKEQRQKLPAA